MRITIEAFQSETAVTTDWAQLRPEVTPALLDQIVQRIVARFHPHRIVLFGSYAYGQLTLDSDLDLLVLMDSDEPMFPRIRKVSAVAEVPFLPIDIIVRTPEEMAERTAMGDPFMREVMTRGVVLYDNSRRVDRQG